MRNHDVNIFKNLIKFLLFLGIELRQHNEKTAKDVFHCE